MRSFRSFFLIGALAAASFGAAQAAPVATLKGPVGAVDGLTVQVQGQRVALWGVAAPGAQELCRGNPCAAQATWLLTHSTNNGAVTCVAQGMQGGLPAAICTTDEGLVLNSYVVGMGLARATAEGPYASAQDAAQQHRAGLWAAASSAP